MKTEQNDAPLTIQKSASERVWTMLARVPPGRVITYGGLARLAAVRGGGRQVGWIMARLPAELDLPAHRVVNARGELSGGWAFGHPMVMKQLLEDEGVTFVADYRVDLAKHRWPDDS